MGLNVGKTTWLSALCAFRMRGVSGVGDFLGSLAYHGKSCLSDVMNAKCAIQYNKKLSHLTNAHEILVMFSDM